LFSEWVIEMDSKTIGLSKSDNDEINRKAIQKKRTIVVYLQIEGKKRK
jgi:hypothetical protein